VRKAERAWFLSEGEESEALRKNGAREKMVPGPIFCCYVLKLRMSSFLQNGAWHHFFPFFLAVKGK